MLTRLVFLLFCGALVNAKTLVQRDPRHSVFEEKEIQHEKLPSFFKDLIRKSENDQVEPNEYDQVGTNPLVQIDNTIPIKDDLLVPKLNEEKKQVSEGDENDDNDEEASESDAEDEETKKDAEKKRSEEELKDDEVEESNEDDGEDDEASQKDAQEKNTKDELQKEDEVDESSDEEENEEVNQNNADEKNTKDENETKFQEDEVEESSDDEEDEEVSQKNADEKNTKNEVENELQEDEVEESSDDDEEDEEVNQKNVEEKNTKNEVEKPLEEGKTKKSDMNEENKETDTINVENAKNKEIQANEIDENKHSKYEEKEEEEPISLNPQTVFETAPKTKPSGTPIGSENLYQDSIQYAKSYVDSLISASQNPANKKLAQTIANFFDLKSLAKNVDLESLMKNVLPQKKSSPEYGTDNKENDFSNLDDASWMKMIKNLEDENKIEQTNDNNGLEINLDNLENLQMNFQRVGNFWQNNLGNRNFKRPVQKEPKVGFGGWEGQTKLLFGNLTTYVNKAVHNAQAQLEENGRVIQANNPPLVINMIPGLPIIFELKHVEGAHTLDTHGQSKGIHYNKLYAFTQCKFTELRYYYDVTIKPLNSFGIRKSITIILNDAPVKMSLSVENDNSLKILGLEFVNPEVSVDVGSHRYINYGINYLLNEYMHPVVRQKLIEIVSRDSKFLLTEYLKDAQ